MYLKWLNTINNKKLILGSSSIQRKQILTEMGFKYDVIVSNFPENLSKTNAKEYVEQTCFEKLKCIVKDNPINDIDILVTSDSIVELDGKILEKAENEKEAIEWLISYSKKELKVLSSVCIAIIEKDNKCINYIKDIDQFTETTLVEMNEITHEIAESYVKTGEWYNRAGAVAAQLIGRCLVKRINGDFYTIVGFPISAFCEKLPKILEKNYSLII